MPFRSAKQRRYLWANEPEIARRWTKEHGSRIQKDDGGIMRLPFQTGGNYLPSTAAQKIKIVPDNPSTNARTWKTNSRIEDFLRNDPFYWSGGYKLENVKSFSDDPNIARAQRNIEKESMGYNPYSDPNIYVRNINDPNPWVGSDVTHEGIHDVISPTFASQTERGNIIQDVITDYSATLPPGKRSSINPKAMNEIVTNYISNMIHGDVESLEDATEIDKDLMKALKKNIDPAIGQGYFKKYASRAHQNINAMNQERLNQMLGIPSLDVDEDEDNVPLRFRDAKTLAEYYNQPQRDLRRARRVWNRGETRTVPERFRSGLRNVGGDIRNIGRNIGNYGQRWMGGLRNIGQGIGRFMGDRFKYRPAVSPAGGYSAAQLNQLNARGGYYSEPKRQQRFDQDRIDYMLDRKAKGLNYSIPNLASLQQQDGGGGIPDTSGWKSPGAPGAPAHRTRELMYTGGLASIWPR